MTTDTEVKACKIRQKNYNLVNEVTGQSIIVHPPEKAGKDEDGVDPKDENGNWIRNFRIVDHKGMEKFENRSHILFTYSPKLLPSIVIDGEKWQVEVIPKDKPVSKRKVKAVLTAMALANASTTPNVDVSATPSVADATVGE